MYIRELEVYVIEFPLLLKLLFGRLEKQKRTSWTPCSIPTPKKLERKTPVSPHFHQGYMERH
jgi:hypothetical protein